MFVDFVKEICFIQVKKKKISRAVGIGNVQIMSKVNDKLVRITLQDVLFAPKMILNKISACQAWKWGHKTVIENSPSTESGDIFKYNKQIN